MYMNMQTLNISLPKNLVKKLDSRAKKEYKNRSELMRDAFRAYLTEHEEWDQIFSAGEDTMKRMGIKTDEEVNKIIYDFRHKQKTH